MNRLFTLEVWAALMPLTKDSATVDPVLQCRYAASSNFTFTQVVNSSSVNKRFILFKGTLASITSPYKYLNYLRPLINQLIEDELAKEPAWAMPQKKRASTWEADVVTVCMSNIVKIRVQEDPASRILARSSCIICGKKVAT